MSEQPIYLDYAATTPVDSRVAAFLGELFAANYGNASSGHAIGRRSAELVERAATQLADLVNCDPARLFWTSGATESDNLAIAGAARYRERRGKHLITMPTEHKAVTDMFGQLEKEGFEVTWLKPRPDGRADLAELENALRDDTQIVSIMYVNNETGVVQDLSAVGDLCRARDVLFHVDAAQGLGKLPVDLSELPVDLMSFTAHKLYGPKGIGALYVADRPGCHLEPLLFGGGQQRRLRPGTLPVPLIAAFGLAAEVAAESMQADLEHISALADRLWTGIRGLPGVQLNGAVDRHKSGAVDRKSGAVDRHASRGAAVDRHAVGTEIVDRHSPGNGNAPGNSEKSVDRHNPKAGEGATDEVDRHDSWHGRWPVDRHFPGIVNVSAENIEGESLLLALEPLCVATGSACTSQDKEPSTVLRALGLSDALAQSAIRFSIGRPTTAEEIDRAIELYTTGVERLRALAPERAA